MVMTVSNIRQMSKSFEVEGGGTTVGTVAAAGSTGSSTVAVPVEEEGGGATPEVSTQGHLELALI